MLKMSFYYGTLDKAEAKKAIMKSEKPCVYTYGFEYRNPTTHRVPKTKEEACDIIDTESWLDIDEEETCFHLNAFSENDMR